MYNIGKFYKKSLAAFVPSYDKVWNCYFGYVNPSKYKTGLPLWTYSQNQRF